MRFFSLLAILVALTAQADEFVLSNGGTVRGTLLNADEDPRVTYHIRLDKGGEVTLDVEAVRKVVVPSPEKRRYEELLAKLPNDSAELHWKMAEQCAKWSLSRERQFHLEQTIRLDPHHEQARRALRHKKRKDGSWAEVSEIMEDSGKVRRNGRWVTKQQAQMEDEARAHEEAERQWKKKLRIWRRWLADQRRRADALREIEQIEDPSAVGPLVELFRSDKNPSLRDVLAEVLGRFHHGQATEALVEAAMFGPRELQLQCLRQLEKSGRTDAVQRFLPNLRSSENQLVRRAGYALGILGDDQVVLPLIKALNTTHTELVGGAGDGRINLRAGGLSAGQTKPKERTVRKQNREVLSALIKLTGQDWRYNEQLWMKWYLERSTPPNLDLRREE